MRSRRPVYGRRTPPMSRLILENPFRRSEKPSTGVCGSVLPYTGLHPRPDKFCPGLWVFHGSSILTQCGPLQGGFFFFSNTSQVGWFRDPPFSRYIPPTTPRFRGLSTGIQDGTGIVVVELPSAELAKLRSSSLAGPHTGLTSNTAVHFLQGLKLALVALKAEVSF